MHVAALFPHLSGLHVQHPCINSGTLTLVVAAVRRTASCPLCHCRSRRIHSRYWRHPADLPINSLRVILHVHVRRFFCDNPRCSQRTFAERFPTLVAPRARRTRPCADWLTRVAFALGGEAGMRLLRHLGIVVCGDTLLTHIRRFAFAARPTPRVLSVDDFALRRGRTYGSILVDLERHQTVDLLPDRTTDLFANWLTGHPGIEVVSRDRSGEYAEAVRQGAPLAVQVADRFHLLRNLRDVALRVFKRHAQRIGQIATPSGSQTTLTRLRLDRQAAHEQTCAEMRARFETIHRLAAQGLNRSAIARHLGLHRHTVQKYLASDSPLERRHYSRKTSMLAPYEHYLLAQWQAGRRNAMQLWREIVAQGYAGSYRNVSRLTGYLRKHEGTHGTVIPLPAGLTPAQAAGILLTRPEHRTAAERTTLVQLLGLHPELAAVISQWESFACLLRDRDDPHPACRLEQWLAEATRSAVPELKAFATKLRQDLVAVLAALTSPYSQGQTEGRITKLKLIKRSMYGRAKFDLLRQRVLYASSG